MHVLITGAAGTLATRLTRSILAEPPQGFARLTLVDRDAPPTPAGAAAPIVAAALDLADGPAVARRIGRRPDVIYHFAAGSEADPGWRDGFDATRRLFDAIAATPDYAPRLVLASSIAVFGPPAPPVIADDHAPAPASGFGAQLAAAELLLADRVRTGAFDGMSLRLPVVAGAGGAWGFADWIAALLRDPPAGREAVLPVDAGVRLWLTSRRAAVFHLRQAAELDPARVGPRRVLVPPGVPARAGEIVQALERVAGVADRVRAEPRPEAERLAAGWPGWCEAALARTLGFRPEASLDALVEAELAEDGVAPKR